MQTKDGNRFGYELDTSALQCPLVNSLHLAACLFYPFAPFSARKGCLKQIGDEVVNTTARKQANGASHPFYRGKSFGKL